MQNPITKAVLNNTDRQEYTGPESCYLSAASGRVKKVRPARPQPFSRAERTLRT